MDLRQLASLVAVAETGTFSAAATNLHTVQSNVSTHVARLERELGVTLVDRSAGRLTGEGEVVVARARRIQAELADRMWRGEPPERVFPVFGNPVERRAREIALR